jgi:nucleoside-diphosphate-sugar epimerase
MSEHSALVLVTGANGFVGSHLVEALLARGYRVRCMVRHTSNLAFISSLPVEWAYTGLEDPDGLRQACAGVDAVCHCAALTRALDEATFMRANADGTVALAQACAEASPGLRRFLFVSSQAAAGLCATPDQATDECCPSRPITWYGRSKLAAEQALQRLADRLPISIVRPAAVFGPRDRDFYAYFRLVKLGLDLQLGREERWLSLIYVHDLVRLLLLALESEQAVGRTYFGCGLACRRTEMSAAIARALEKRTRRVALPVAALAPIALMSRATGRLTRRPALLNDQRLLDIRQLYWLCSGEKARRELGFEPRYDLQTAVQETADWYLANGWM